MVALSLFTLFLATTTLAAPSKRQDNGTYHGACNVPASAFQLPAPLAPLSSPPRFTTVGVGVQNYTCAPSGNYSSVGALGQVFDISCLFGKPGFSTIQEDAFNVWSEWSDCEGSLNPFDPGLATRFKEKLGLDVIDQHYFVNQNNSLVPVFDSTSSGSTKGDKNAIFFGKKIEDIPSPDGSENVDWLQLQQVSGELANTIYRVHTFKGQPPAACTPGSADISIKYATEYLMV